MPNCDTPSVFINTSNELFMILKLQLHDHLSERLIILFNQDTHINGF